MHELEPDGYVQWKADGNVLSRIYRVEDLQWMLVQDNHPNIPTACKFNGTIEQLEGAVMILHPDCEIKWEN